MARMLYKIYQQHIFPHLLNQVMQTPALMDLRRELLLGVSNEVLEIGFGTGLNLPFYQLVDKLYALEPNADIFKLAETRIQQAAFPVEHILASAENLPFAANSLQHVVSTWDTLQYSRSRTELKGNLSGATAGWYFTCGRTCAESAKFKYPAPATFTYSYSKESRRWLSSEPRY